MALPGREGGTLTPPRARYWLFAASLLVASGVLLMRRPKGEGACEASHPPSRSEHALIGTKEIERGLKWLASAQEADGSWSCSRWSDCGSKNGLPGVPDHADELLDPAVTGLATLPFILEGHPTGPDPYIPQRERALFFLRVTGDSYVRMGLPVHAGDPARQWHWGAVADEYNPVVVFAALAEAFRTTRDARLRPVVEGGVWRLTTERRPDRAWARSLSPFDIGPVVFWVEALDAAERARVQIPGSARGEARAYLAEMTERETGRIRSKDVCPECLGGWDARAIAILTRRWIHPDGDPTCERETETILAHAPRWETSWNVPEDPSKGMTEVWRCSKDIVNFFYWYYGALAVGGAGPRAVKWREDLWRALVEHQVSDGANAGSWDPVDPWGRIGGRVYSTAYAVLALESIAACAK